MGIFIGPNIFYDNISNLFEVFDTVHANIDYVLVKTKYDSTEQLKGRIIQKNINAGTQVYSTQESRSCWTSFGTIHYRRNYYKA